MFINATRDQIHASQVQKATMMTQYRYLLAQLDRRMLVAVTNNDRYLINQLQADQEFIAKQLL